MGLINTRDATAAARAYINLDWPLTLGHRHRPRGGCTCGNRTCPTPGAHPHPGTLTPLGERQLLDAVSTTPGVALIATTAAVDALILPKRPAMATIASLDRGAPVPCLTATTWAAILVLPATGRYARGDLPHPDLELRTGPRQWIPLPPTHGISWDTPPWNEQTGRPLPLLHGKDLRPYLAEALAHETGGRP